MSVPTRENVSTLMPQLKDELARLVAIPSLSEWGVPGAHPRTAPRRVRVGARTGYRFGDYWKLGLPMLALFGLVAVLLVPVIWSF